MKQAMNGNTENLDVKPPPACPFRAGMERHVVPSGNDDMVVTKTSSDAIFGASGLGFKDGAWARIISWLARNGIQEQTGSNPDETDIENCVKGWGQGPFSSRVFDAERGIDQDQLERLIEHLEAIASSMKIHNGRITAKVLAAFVGSQKPQPYSTWNGMREVDSFRGRVGARFRGHIQWQALCDLCGQMDGEGVKHVTPELLRTFFNSEQPFFDRVVDRRRRLRTGALEEGDRSGLLADVPQHIDLKATDREYRRNKSGFALVARIGWFMLTRTGSRFEPLLADPKRA